MNPVQATKSFEEELHQREMKWNQNVKTDVKCKTKKMKWDHYDQELVLQLVLKSKTL